MGFKTVRILILTSLAPTRKLLKKALEDDFELIFFSKAEEALAEFRKKLPDAVITDFSLKEETVFQLIDKVRNHPITRNLPFIIVSRQASNAAILRAVRAGISHYVGIPFEQKVLVDKVYFALTEHSGPDSESYFELPAEFETQAVFFGRISFISPQGIHFESHLRLEPDSRIQISSPLSDGIQESSLDVVIKSTSRDTFYRFPFAYDADWTDEKIKRKVTSWISAHRHLNSPKKAKVLVVSNQIPFQESFVKEINLSHYSVRFADNLGDALNQLPFMRPSCVIVADEDWKRETSVFYKKFLMTLEELQAAWIVFGDKGVDPAFDRAPFFCPPNPSAVAMAVREKIPPAKADPDKLYFSKTLEDSRLRLYVPAKTLVLGELGIELALSRDVRPPCNLQLDLKIFSEQNLRNPFVRAWPPVRNLAPHQTSSGKYPYSVRTHFLGINDPQGQEIRKWLREEEIKERASQWTPVPPKKNPDPEPSDENN